VVIASAGARCPFTLLDNCGYPSNNFYGANKKSILSTSATKLYYFEGAQIEDFEPLVDIDKAFEPILAWDTISKLPVLSVGMFDKMNDNPCHVLKD